MAVFRVEKTKNFTVMSNHHLKNRKITLKAKGLLSLMLSLPEEWDYTLKGLAHISLEGVDAIRVAMLELEKAGYIERSRKRIFVQPPDLTARSLIFRLKLKGKPVDNVNYEFLAENTELYSGADIENVVEVATENVINEILNTGNERPIVMNDLAQAILSTKPTTIDWLKTINNYVKYANQSGLYDDVRSYISKHRKLLL